MSHSTALSPIRRTILVLGLALGLALPGVLPAAQAVQSEAAARAEQPGPAVSPGSDLTSCVEAVVAAAGGTVDREAAGDACGRAEGGDVPAWVTAVRLLRAGGELAAAETGASADATTEVADDGAMRRERREASQLRDAQNAARVAMDRQRTGGEAPTTGPAGAAAAAAADGRSAAATRAQERATAEDAPRVEARKDHDAAARRRAAIRSSHGRSDVAQESAADGLVAASSTIVAAPAPGTGSISGTVTASLDGAPLDGICVYASSVDFNDFYDTATGVDGTYEFLDIAPNDYRIEFYDCGAGGYVSEWYDDAAYDTATIVSVPANSGIVGIDAALSPGGGISGSVTEDGTGAPLVDICVDVYDDANSYGFTYTDVNGDYLIEGLANTPHTVQFYDCSGSQGHTSEYYDDATYDTRDLVTVVSDTVVAGIDAGLAPAGSISGTVTEDGTGTPLAEICVSAYDEFDSYGYADTDANGDYVITGLAATPHIVDFYDCSFDGGRIGEYYDDVYAYEDATPVAVSAGADTGGIDAGLALAGSVSGTVTAADGGAPLGDICVDVFTADYVGYGWATTAPDGTYTATDLQPGSYYVNFYDCGSNDVVAEFYDGTSFLGADLVVVGSGADVVGIDAALGAGGSVAGTVTAQDGGEALANICVDVIDGEYHSYGSTMTAFDGTWTVSGLSPGPHYVVFYDCWNGQYGSEYYDGASRSDATTVTVVTGSTVGGIDAALGAGGSITGTVTADDGGAPLGDICVDAEEATDGFYYYANGWDVTASDGSYAVGGLAPGRYAVSFYDCYDGDYVGEYHADVARLEDATLVDVARGATVPGINAGLATGGTISGTVTDDDDGAPLEDICVYAYSEADDAWWWSNNAYTDASGAYTVRGLRTGSYEVDFYDCADRGYIGEVYDDGTPTLVDATIGAATTGVDAGLALGGSITGTVTDELDGAPLQSICVDAWADMGDGYGSYGYAYTATDGTYTVRGLETGDYTVEFSDCNQGVYGAEYYDDADYDTATLVPVVRPQTTAGIDAALYGGSSITGTVVADSDGAPLPYICVEAYAPSGSSIGWAETGPDGTYRVAGLSAEDHVVRFYDCGFSFDSYEEEWYDDAASELDATVVTVPLDAVVAGIDASLAGGPPPMQTISGMVTEDGTDAPLEGICVDASGVDGWSYSFTVTEADGTYVLPDVPDGDYILYFSECAGGLHVAEYYDDVQLYEDATAVTVAGASVTGIDASLLAGGGISGTVRDGAGQPIAGACLFAVDRLTDEYVAFTSVDAAGEYVLGGFANSGSFDVQAYDCESGLYMSSWYDGVADQADATPVSVAAGAVTSGIDFTLELAGWIEGVVRSTTGTLLEDVCVDVRDLGGSYVAFGYSDASGAYLAAGLHTGDYIVEFTDCSFANQYAGEFHDDVHAFASATPVAVTTGAGTTIDAELAPYSTGTGSITGLVQKSTGGAVSGAFVSVCGGDGRCVSTTTDGGGAYALGSLADGSYTVRAQPPAGFKAGSTTAVVTGGGATSAPTLVLEPLATPPAGTSIGGTSGGTGTTPVVYVNQPFPAVVSEPPCDTGGAVTYTITSSTGEQVTGELVEGPPGTWSGDIIVPFTGTSDVVISQVGCDLTLDFNIYIDPSGTVKTPAGDPIEGATITLYRGDTVGGPFTVVPDGSTIMAPSNRTNPDLSDAEGAWGWDVAEGYYYVTAEKAGCVDPLDGVTDFVATPVYEIPPAVVDIDLRLDCTPAAGLEFVPVAPCAVFDTRSGTGVFAGRADAGEVSTFQVTGTVPVAQGGADCEAPPADAVAVELNLVAVGATAPGNLQIAPSGVVANGGVVNFVPGTNNSNALSVEVDGDGEVDVTVKGGSVHLRGVVLGYYTDVDASGLEFVPVAPCAVFDTRSGTGAFAGRADAGEVSTFQVTGTVPVAQGGADCEAPPADAVAVQLNLVAVGATAPGNLQIAPSGVVANGGVVNFVPGTNNSNALSVEVDGDGEVDVTVKGGSVHLRGVVLGYYTDVDASGLEFVPVAPCAVFDTRSGTGAFAGRADGAAVPTFRVTGAVPAAQGGAACDAPPTDARAVHINLIAVGATGPGNLQIAPAGTPANGGVVNFEPGVNNSNALDVEVADGEIDITVKGSAVHVRGVVLGYRVPGD